MMWPAKREPYVEDLKKKHTGGSWLRRCMSRVKSTCRSAKDDSGRSPKVSTTECLCDCDESGGPRMSGEQSRASMPQPMAHTQTSSLVVSAIEQAQRPGTAPMQAETQSESRIEGHFLGDAEVIVSEAGRGTPPVPFTQPPKAEYCAGAAKAGSTTETQSGPMREGRPLEAERKVDPCSKKGDVGAKPTPGTLLGDTIGETGRTIGPWGHQLPGGRRSSLSGLTGTYSASVDSTNRIKNDFPTSSVRRQMLWRKRCSRSVFEMAGWPGSPIKSLPNHLGGESLPEGFSGAELGLKKIGDGTSTRDQRSPPVSLSQVPSLASPQATRVIQCPHPDDKTTQIAYRRAIALRALEQQQMGEDERMAARLRGGGCCGGGQVRVDTRPHSQDPGVPTPTRESQHPPRAIVEKQGQPTTSMKSGGSTSGGGARSRAQSHVSEKPNPERSRRPSQTTMREGASVSRQPSQRGTRSRTTSQVESRSRKQSRVGEQPPMPPPAHGSRSRKPSTVPVVPSIP